MTSFALSDPKSQACDKLTKGNNLWVLSCFSQILLFVTPWTVTDQAPLSMGFSQQEYCRGLPCPPPGYLPDPGSKLASPVSFFARRFFTTESLEKPISSILVV